MTRKPIARATLGAACACLAFAAPPAGGREPRSNAQPSYLPGEVVVGYSAPTVAARIVRATRLAPASSPAPDVQVLRLRRGQSVQTAVARLRRFKGVAYAVPDYLAHIASASSWTPDDPGRVHQPQGWERTQWNFLSGSGLDAPGAWGNLIADGHPGGRGAVIAVLDTGVAYRNWGQFARSPDFGGTRFIDPYDFVANNAFPLDREGHGTFVTGEIAETTNNNYGLTGLAYGASIMPVRVLAADGSGDAATIARGIRYAVGHGARIINLSLEFGIDIQPSDIPEVLNAIRFAYNHGVLVVGAAGNDEAEQIAYPARAYGAVAVGATTRDRCLGWYSNLGSSLALVAPGGGDDASLAGDLFEERFIHRGRRVNPLRLADFRSQVPDDGSDLTAAVVTVFDALQDFSFGGASAAPGHWDQGKRRPQWAADRPPTTTTATAWSTRPPPPPESSGQLGDRNHHPGDHEHDDHDLHPDPASRHRLNGSGILHARCASSSRCRPPPPSRSRGPRRPRVGARSPSPCTPTGSRSVHRSRSRPAGSPIPRSRRAPSSRSRGASRRAPNRSPSCAQTRTPARRRARSDPGRRRSPRPRSSGRSQIPSTSRCT